MFDRQVSASSMGLFRLCFGILLIVQSFVVFHPQYILENYIQNAFHFPHSLYVWLHLPDLSAGWMYSLFLMMGIAAIGITFGILYKQSLLVFILSSGYVFLYEKALYFDHYYLILLICFILFLSPYPSWPCTKDIPFVKNQNTMISLWSVCLLRFQFIIVYFFAGLSKLNTAWIVHAEPVRSMLAHKTIFGFALSDPWIAYLFSWSGLIVDLALPLLLIWGRWRWLTFGTIFLFNVINIWLFEGDINTFPFLMMIGYIPFLHPDLPSKFFSKKMPQEETCREIKSPSPALIIVLGSFICYQMLMPLRQWIYPGNASWSLEGARFSWRLKINGKKVKLKIRVQDRVTKETQIFLHQENLTHYQQWIDNMPDALVQFAHEIRKSYLDFGWADPQVFIESVAHLPGYPPQSFIDETQDLTQISTPYLKPAKWINPLKNP